MPAIRIWSKPKVIEEITELQKRKEPLNARYIQTCYRALFNAGERHWGSWENSIEAAGIDYSSVKITDPVVSWSNRLIIERLREFRRRGEPLNSHYIRKHYPALFYSAVKSNHFGSWKNAIESLGIDYSYVKKRDFHRKPWTDEIIIDELVRLHNADVDLSTAYMRKIYPGFFEYIRQKKGGWRAVIEMAGLDYEKVLRYRTLTEQEKTSLFLDYTCLNGITIRELAEKYSISYSTARRHIKRMLKNHRNSKKKLREISDYMDTA